ncbi:MAG: hypothetical protein J6P61_08110 [Erysipelotrichaceae bacterium]|nr:hypothetical protein [Erysipelotrichaceae bacterium]
MNDTNALFETASISHALRKMCIPTIISQLIILIYNIADTWYIGRTNNHYMVAALSLVSTVYLMLSALANLFGVGGGSLAVRLMGIHDEEEAKKVSNYSFIMSIICAGVFSLFCFVFMTPMLRFLGASDDTLNYARQYLMFVVVIGGIPTVLANTMSFMVRNIGYSHEAGFGLSMGGLLNVFLDPLFMFVILPDGFQVMGAAIATMLSNFIVCIYFFNVYIKSDSDILMIPRRFESIRRDSVKSLFLVGIPAALSLFLFDLTNIVINKLSAMHGDYELAAIGIVLKVERLPLNIGIGICLGMVPLVAYNYAQGNKKRMLDFFKTARTYGLIVSIISVVLYYVLAPYIINIFINDATTIDYGTLYLRRRCFATPFMFLSFHMVHFFQSVDEGPYSLLLAVIRQLCLNIPILFIFNALFGMNGVVLTQVTADILNVIASYMIFYYAIRFITTKPQFQSFQQIDS